MDQKVHCSVLADDALKDAIRDYLKKSHRPVPTELTQKRNKINPFLADMKRRG